MREPIRTQIININSYYRSSGNINNFTVNLNNLVLKLEEGNNGYIKIEPVQVCIPRSYYSVNENNNMFQVDDGTITIDIVFPVGNYNVKTFLSALQTFFPDWLIAWHESLNKYYFKPPNDGKTYTFYFPTFCSELMGFHKGSTIVITHDNPVFSVKPVRMHVESVLLVHASFPKIKHAVVDNLLNSELRESDIIAKVPINCPPYDNLIWRANARDVLSFQLSAHYITDLRLTITDEYNNLVPLMHDWTCTFRIEYYLNEDPLNTMNSYMSQLVDFARLFLFTEETKNQKEAQKRTKTAASK